MFEYKPEEELLREYIKRSKDILSDIYERFEVSSDLLSSPVVPLVETLIDFLLLTAEVADRVDPILFSRLNPEIIFSESKTETWITRFQGNRITVVPDYVASDLDPLGNPRQSVRYRKRVKVIENLSDFATDLQHLAEILIGVKRDLMKGIPYMGISVLKETPPKPKQHSKVRLTQAQYEFYKRKRLGKRRNERKVIKT